MRGNPFARFSFLATLLAVPFTFNTAHAVDYSGEAHCFSGPKTAYESPQTRYANGTLSDPDQVAAVEELTRRMWKLRLSNAPLAFEREVSQETRSSLLDERSSRYSFLRTWSSIQLDRAQERRNRRTGSRYIMVRPEMKQLARERSELRILKRKPCNKHILYLG
ncbi:MAG: hypothetical protein AAGK38_12845 [Pseudomonadota bacterium]